MYSRPLTENENGSNQRLNSMKYVVEVGDMKIGKKGDLLVTYALGSCLGLTVFDPETHVGGLLHAMLPLSKINPQKAEVNPFMFVDTGVPELFKAVYAIGGQKPRMVVKATGCGGPLGKNGIFKIGERNYAVLKKVFGKNSISLASEDIGGTESRTIYLDLSTGHTTITSNGKKWEL
jgi:chemotaxis protein CheD